MHTPGPWNVFEHAPYSVWAGGKAAGDTVIAEYQIAACRWVDEDGNPEGYCDRNDERAQANARLIAAAPDLLAALEQILREDDGDITVGNRSMARAALAKAKGA